MPPPEPLRTPRLTLHPGVPEQAPWVAATGRDGAAEALAKTLGARAAPDWPPPLLDQEAARVLRDRLDQPAARRGWATWWIVLRDPAPATLAGIIGFHGPPDEHGEVELGYAVVRSHQRRGIAPEALEAITAWALAQRGVTRVTATTYPDHRPSVRVLQRCGYRPAGPGMEPGTVRYLRA